MSDRRKRQTPDEIKVGGVYRIKKPFGNGPADDVVIVTAIWWNSKVARTVAYQWLGGSGDIWENYAPFKRSVWREEPRAIQ